VSSRFSQSFICQLAAANGVDPQSPPINLDGTETALVASFNTVPVYMKDCDAFSFHFSTVAGSTLVGTLTMQASNDRGQKEDIGQPDNASLQNWVPISMWDFGAGAQAANKAVVTAANQLMLGDHGVSAYRWVRLVFAFTSGSGQPKVTFQQKGYS
jgi:hypothetical protein